MHAPYQSSIHCCWKERQKKTKKKTSTLNASELHPSVMSPTQSLLRIKKLKLLNPCCILILGLNTGITQGLVVPPGRLPALPGFVIKWWGFSHFLAIRDTLSLTSVRLTLHLQSRRFADKFSRGLMLFCSVKLNLEVFCTEGDAKGLLAAVQVLLHQQLQRWSSSAEAHSSARDLQKINVVMCVRFLCKAGPLSCQAYLNVANDHVF